MRFDGLAKTIELSNAFAKRPWRAAGGLAATLDSRLTASGLPPEVGFLASYGVAPSALIAASRRANKEGVSPDEALLAYGGVTERFFYQCLARHLGVVFIDEPVRLRDGIADHYPQAIRSGLVAFEGPAGPCWLAAPRGKGLVTLLRTVRRGGAQRSRLAITTPAHLSRCVREGARRRMAADASFGLLSTDAELSAHSGSNPFQCSAAWIGLLSAALSFAVLPFQSAADLWAAVIGLMFFAALFFRSMVLAAALDAPRAHRAPPLEDHQLPTYTIVAALSREARIVKRLTAMLDKIDYPRAKLDIKFVIEEDDHETRRALEALPLAPVYEIIVAPAGLPRTKPRALNIALPLVRGDLCVVFDAEDAPDPQQLRRAAAHFAAEPARLACLQARLSIENADETWLTRLFAIEYAALFHVQNVGLADLNLPLPVSGSSNHFRTSVLRAVHGWDAWNVTEDADLGLRLARFGYRVDVLDSMTGEEAPVSLRAWFLQRCRWYKGWLQTFITISRSPSALLRDIGLVRTGTLTLFFFGLLFGPLFWIPSSLLLTTGLVSPDLWTPADAAGVCLATLWASVALLGLGSIFCYAFFGMKRQGLLRLWPALALLLPYYCLHAAAAWMALYELFRHPFHWHKTEHGLALGAKTVPPPAGQKAFV